MPEYRGFGPPPEKTPDWTNINPPQDGLANIPGMGLAVEVLHTEGVVIPAVAEYEPQAILRKPEDIIVMAKNIGLSMGYKAVRLDRMQHSNGAYYETRYVHGEVALVFTNWETVRVWFDRDDTPQVIAAAIRGNAEARDAGR